LVLLDATLRNADGFEVAEEILHDAAGDGAVIMMFSSAGQRGDARRCRELGISAYLTKPIGEKDLLDAILTVLGRRSQPRQSESLVTRHTLREDRRVLKVLLAEDNPVNQKLAQRVLAKRGHRVVTAGDGRAALDLWAAGGCDLILMDVEMPGLDGLEATRRIRREEAELGRRTPIVGMTAHAMAGDRERCLAAGMDGYLAKPFKVEELIAAVEGHAGVRPSGGSGSPG
jgi:CheY-like chemotaxis protein